MRHFHSEESFFPLEQDDDDDHDDGDEDDGADGDGR